MFEKAQDSNDSGPGIGVGIQEDINRILGNTETSEKPLNAISMDGILGQGMKLEVLYMQLIKADMMLQDYRMAGIHVENWLKRTPKSSPALYFKAKVLSNLGQTEEALKLVNQSMETGPQRPEALYLKAHLLHKLHRVDDALEECNSVVKMLRRDTEKSKRLHNLHLLMGKLYEEKEDYTKAEKSYGLLAKLDPEKPMPHFRRGKMLLKLEKAAEAEAEFSEVVRIWSMNCGQSKNCREYFKKNKAAQEAFNFIYERSNEKLKMLNKSANTKEKGEVGPSLLANEMQQLCKQLNVAF